MSFIPNKELKIKEKQDKMLKEQLEKEREHQLLAEIDNTEKERIKKNGNTSSFILQWELIFGIGLKLLKTSGILEAY